MPEEWSGSEALIEQVVHGRSVPAALPRLTLRQYRKLAREFIPSQPQIDDFVDYVAGAKSWYKHLPLWPPGVPFHFFIDPWAGLDRLLMPDGRVAHLRRTDEQRRFHHSWIKTDDYRSKYGRLTFAADAGDSLFFTLAAQLPDGKVLRGMVDGNWSRITIHLGENGEFQLPDELLAAGRVELTGMMHRLASNPGIWVMLTGLEQPADSAPQNPGVAVACEVTALLKRRLPEVEGANPSQYPGEPGKLESELIALLAPERERMRREITAAIHAVVRLTRRRFFF